MLLSCIIIGAALCIIGICRCFYYSSIPAPLPSPAPTATPSPTPTSSAVPSPTPVPELTEEQLNVIEMQKQNPDVIGYISIPNTNVQYFVLQGEDNSFYLNKNEQKESSINGAIFLDITNSKAFTDKNSIIYGHRMNSGAMFADLHKFADRDFFEQNRFLTIYTPDKVLKYEVFAAYKTDDTYLPSVWDFNNDYQWKKYLDQLGSKDEDEHTNISQRKISGDDHLITLSTCVRYEDDKRYFVQAALVQ